MKNVSETNIGALLTALEDVGLRYSTERCCQSDGTVEYQVWAYIGKRGQPAVATAQIDSIDSIPAAIAEMESDGKIKRRRDARQMAADQSVENS